ncbi:MAG: hypothetical protein RKO66_16240 [Candidatus Contendobacter sp.]|nr:hypothetical protein [Candidatus Contendobacter sp.]MDS4058540.1 hypothetical protein [Candidatus Contendobacter sp.]
MNWVDPSGLVLPNAIGAIGGAVFGGVSSFVYTIVTAPPGPINIGTLVENTLAGAAFGAISGATFGATTISGAVVSSAVYGSGAGIVVGEASITAKEAVKAASEDSNDNTPSENDSPNNGDNIPSENGNLSKENPCK